MILRTLGCDGDDCDYENADAVLHAEPCSALDIPEGAEDIRIQVYLEDFGTMPPN